MILRSLVSRLIGALPVIFLVSIVAFSLVHIVPGDPALQVAGEEATPAQLEAARERLGVNEPLLTQYWEWASDAVRGDLGESLFAPISVSERLVEAGWRSLSLAFIALAIAVTVGVLSGVLAALREGRFVDKAVGVVQAALIAMPSFWLGIILITYFALNRSWFPPTGYSSPSEGLWQWLSHLILPALALSSTAASVISRHTRTAVVSILQQDYVRTARAGGASTRTIVQRYVLRNAAITILTVIGLQVGFLVGGTVVIETVFQLNGLGTLAVRSVVNHDYPMVQGTVVIVGAFVILVNLLVDIAYGVIDPRVGDGRS